MSFQVRDPFFKKAKREGFSARSVYKLKEINEKHKIIKKGDRVLDLGSSPGSWGQYIESVITEKGFLAGVDVRGYGGSGLKNFKFIQKSADALTDDDFIGTPSLFDVITSDMARSTTGASDVDSQASFELAMTALGICFSRLKEGGHFVCKIFESPLVQEFVESLRKSFKEVRRSRPGATRKVSSEVFMVSKNFYGPPSGFAD